MMASAHSYMIRYLLFVAFVVTLSRGSADSISKSLEPTKVTLGDLPADDNADGKRDRAALFGSSKFHPFITDLFDRRQGTVGVSLGLGLPVPAPLPVVRPPARPVIVSGQRPDCAVLDNYCVYDQLYPLDKVNSIIDRYYNDVRHLYSDLYHIPPSDLIYYENRTHAYRQGGHFVCESSVDYVRPGWAQNIHGNWMAVINTDKFPQSVRMEVCSYKDKRCEYLPPCYKSRCVQRYNYMKLVCLDPYRPTKRPSVEVFQIPSACSCFVEDFTYY